MHCTGLRSPAESTKCFLSLSERCGEGPGQTYAVSSLSHRARGSGVTRQSGTEVVSCNVTVMVHRKEKRSHCLSVYIVYWGVFSPLPDTARAKNRLRLRFSITRRGRDAALSPTTSSGGTSVDDREAVRDPRVKVLSCGN